MIEVPRPPNTAACRLAYPNADASPRAFQPARNC